MLPMEVMSPLLQYDIPNIGMSGQPAASEVDDVLIAQSLLKSVREDY